MKLPRIVRSLGPAIIVASIVLGPGSILTSSKVGCQYGYSMLWALVGAVVLMIGMTALGAHLGVLYRRTLCEELARRWHRGAAVAIGVVVFLIIACFQSSNNVAAVASIEGLWTAARQADDAEELGAAGKIAILVGLNGLIIATIYGFRRLYQPLELLMMFLVLGMLLAFSLNLMVARPSLTGIAAGLVPRFPAATSATDGPSPVGAAVGEHSWALFGLIASTFSVAGAYYQSYLVREKGWSASDVRRGLVDSLTGIALLGFVSLTIMVTSAAALHGKIPHQELERASDVARQLEPLFGSFATLLFSAGIFAAAFSSFLGNALIGGTILSDGLGWGSSMDDRWPKRLTVVALLCGMGVAVLTTLTNTNAVNVIVVAQALTVLGVPALALLMLYFGISAARSHRGSIAWWILAVALAGGAVTLMLAVRTGYQLWQRLLGVVA